MKYTGVIISDIHVGAMNLNKAYNEYKEIFLYKIKEMEKLDFLVVTGDFFDHKFYLNDKEAIVAYDMLRDLANICKEREIPLRFVYGTESHECNQYDIFSLLKIYENIKVIKHVSDEELLPELNVLYLPEEHILDKEEYYNNYLSNYDKYNYIFGHGVIREVTSDIAVTIDNKRNANKKRKEVPVFSSKELNRICKGQTFFGHYHINKDIDNKIFSVGSFSRWKFGEERRKGFYIVECDTNKDKYKAIYQENTLADKYTTVSYGYDKEIFKDQNKMEESLNKIENIINKDCHNHIRFIFNIPDNIENPEATIDYIKEKYKFNDYIKTEVVNGYIEEKKEKQKELVNKENEKYGFIFDDNLSIPEKTSRYIEIEYNKKISADEVSNYINNPLKDILNK